MQPDTRKLLTTGAIIFLIGAIAALLMFTVFGGVTKQGPHTNGGWLSLMVAIGCLPTGVLTLLLPPLLIHNRGLGPLSSCPSLRGPQTPSNCHSQLSSVRSLLSSTAKRSTSMAKGVNKVFLLGNVGKDPEIRTTPGGMTVATFSLATADRAKDAQGNWTDKTEWHNLVAFQRTAEIIRDYVKKGSQIFVEGKIQTRSWDDKESGQKKYRTEILINELSLLGGGSGRSEGSSGGERSSGGYTSSRSSSSAAAPASAPANDYADQGITDEDIPF